MNAQQAENLRILIRHMETNVTRTLYMDSYEKCGAPACALGEAKAIGLIKDEQDEHRCSREFGCSHTGIFSMAIINPWGRADVTPQEWAIEARKVLAENGYSMDDKAADDGFAAFRAKLLEPVECVGR